MTFLGGNLMVKDIEFNMWGERGLVATLFLDLSFLNKDQFVTKFINNCNYDPGFSIENIMKINFIIEPGFGSKGFGNPDALINIITSNGKYIFFVEAKTRSYIESAVHSFERGNDKIKFNSKINGQIELNHCLAMVLSKYNMGDEFIEKDWILKSPYKKERKGELRKIESGHVINKIVKYISGMPLENYFHLIVTTDEKNPLEDIKNEDYLPQIYLSETSGNSWKALRKQFGWINYTKILEISGVIDKRIGYSYFKAAWELNATYRKGNYDALDKDVAMIYTPEINPKTFLHFSWAGDSCELRDYSQGIGKPIKDSRFTTREVNKKIKIKKEIPEGRSRPNIEQYAEWYQRTKKLNKEYNLE
jgi:hypothetical protein